MARLRERPVFIYHQIGDYPEAQMTYGITPAAFRAHLDCLVGSGFDIIPLERMIAQMKGEAPFSPRAVSLTFDGGFRDAWEVVLPLLRERNFKAAFFIPTDHVGKENSLFAGTFPCMGWEQLRELVDAGMTVGSFGRRGMALSEMPEAEWREDARASRKILEDRLGIRVRFHAYKEKFPGRALQRWFAGEGYEAVLTQCPTFRRSNLFRIGRIQVDDDDVNILKTKASNLYLFFKDTRTWRFIRRSKLDRVMHFFFSFLERKS